MFIAVGLAVSPLRAQQGSQVTDTRHNLTASGPGPIKTTRGGEACIFCHTPHASNPIAPLWNRDDPGTYYQTYESSTLVADVGQPTGSSRLCLSCHDGTIALSQTYNAQNLGGGSIYLSSADRGHIGTDLRDDHPISFVYDSSLASRRPGLRDPATLPAALPLDHNRQLQCTTCHDPHDDSLGQFLRMENTQSALCRSCHDQQGWATSAHATSVASLAPATRDRWDNIQATTVRDAACASCHRPHAAGGMQRLLRHEAEEDNCFSCHDGTVTGDLLAQFNKLSVHPVGRHTGVHDPTENPVTMPVHVECADCHDPHSAGGGGPTQAPQIQSSMLGASGMTGTGLAMDTAANEYQVCYKCHSVRNMANPVVTRVEGDNNIAHEFSQANASYHPVEGQGRSTDVPSLLQGLNTTSVIYCSSCHGSDDANGPQGPHGSVWRPILLAQYETRDMTFESPQAYALCYACHSRASILGDESFRFHKLHIVDSKTACATCHDPHGVERNPHLINFDSLVVQPSATGTGPTFTDLGVRRGSCTLSCHGTEHNNLGY